MSVLMKSCTASLLLAVSFAASAAGEPAVDTSTPTPDAQIAVRDATTGQLRAPTSAEMKALLAAGVQKAARAPGLGTKTKRNASGATGARLSDQFLSYSILVKQPDGRLVEFCFQSPEAAEAAAAGTAPASRALPTE
jgi:hypothetical protein